MHLFVIYPVWSLFTICSKTFLNAVLEHKKEVLNQHLKEKLVYNYLELRDPLFKQ